MHSRKSFLSSLLSLVVIPAVIVVILIDKPDYNFFNFIHKNTVPFIETIGQGITYPIRLVGRFSASIYKRNEALRDNVDIMARLETFEKISVERDILEKENSLLREKLNMAESIKFESVAGGIVRDNSFIDNRSFVVSSNHPSVSSGNVIISNTGYLLGLVSEKTRRYVKVKSLRDGNSNIPVRITGTNVFGFLQGNGGAAPMLKFLSEGDFIPLPGMFLITSSVNGNVPDNIPVGWIDAVKDGEIQVKLGAEMDNQESVFIMIFNKKEKYE